jgi:hypothetical protein
MERMTTGVRPTGMKNYHRIRAVGAAGLLCAALAGCGTAAATAAAATAAPEVASAPLEVGCASVNQATTVTVVRTLLIAEPSNGGRRTVTQRNATLVRALFRDFCAAVNHPYAEHHLLACPINFGVYYTGTFRDRQRVLATFTYAISGCPRISVTAAGKTRGTLLLGRAAAAAPHIKADFAAVLGQKQSQVYGPPGSQSTGSGKPGA